MRTVLFVLSLVVITSCENNPQVKYCFDYVQEIEGVTGTFAFPDYRDGIVYFDNGTSRNGMMNVNLADNQIYFREYDGGASTYVKYNFEKNKGDVTYAVIDSTVFTYFSKRMLYRLSEASNGVCLEASILPVQDGATKQYSYDVSLFLSKDGKVQPFSVENLNRYFPKSKSAISEISKDENASFQTMMDSFRSFE